MIVRNTRQPYKPSRAISSLHRCKKIEAVIRDDPECLVLYREAMKQKAGARNDLVNNVNEVEAPQKGNTRAYTLDRLKRESPELYQQVTEKKISANAAALTKDEQNNKPCDASIDEGKQKTRNRRSTGLDAIS